MAFLNILLPVDSLCQLVRDYVAPRLKPSDQSPAFKDMRDVLLIDETVVSNSPANRKKAYALLAKWGIGHQTEVIGFTDAVKSMNNRHKKERHGVGWDLSRVVKWIGQKRLVADALEAACAEAAYGRDEPYFFFDDIKDVFDEKMSPDQRRALIQDKWGRELRANENWTPFDYCALYKTISRITLVYKEPEGRKPDKLQLLPAPLFQLVASFLPLQSMCLLSQCSRFCDKAICGSEWTPAATGLAVLDKSAMRKWVSVHNILPLIAHPECPADFVAEINWSRIRSLCLVSGGYAFDWNDLFETDFPRLEALLISDPGFLRSSQRQFFATHLCGLKGLFLSINDAGPVQELHLEQLECPNLQQCLLPAACHLPMIPSGRLSSLCCTVPAEAKDGVMAFRMGQNKSLVIDQFHIIYDPEQVLFPAAATIGEWQLSDLPSSGTKGLQILIMKHKNVRSITLGGTRVGRREDGKVWISGSVRSAFLDKLSEWAEVDMATVVRILRWEDTIGHKTFPQISFVSVKGVEGEALCLNGSCRDDGRMLSAGDRKRVMKDLRFKFRYAEIACHWCKEVLPDFL